MRNYLCVYISCFSESQPSVRPSIRASVRPSVGRSAIKFCKFSEWYRGSLCRQTKRFYRFCVLLKFESIASQQNITVLRRLYVSVEIFCCFVYHSALQMGRPRKWKTWPPSRNRFRNASGAFWNANEALLDINCDLRVPRLHFRVPRLHFGIDSEMQLGHSCESAPFAFQNGRVGCNKTRAVSTDTTRNSMKTLFGVHAQVSWIMKTVFS